LQRLEAVREFGLLEEAEALAAANKRIGNILKKVDFSIPKQIDKKLLTAGAETELAQALEKVIPLVQDHFAKGNFTAALKSFAMLRSQVDSFFNDVMVMDPNTTLRDNRLALLSQMHNQMNCVADIGKLAN